MGTPGKWLKSLITNPKKPTSNDQEKISKKKWKLWRTSSDYAKKDQVESSESAALESAANVIA